MRKSCGCKYKGKIRTDVCPQHMAEFQEKYPSGSLGGKNVPCIGCGKKGKDLRFGWCFSCA